jgi:Transposase IS66 family
VDRPPPITDAVFAAFLQCPLKAYLKLQGAVGEPSDFEAVQARRAAEYRAAARDELWRRQGVAVPQQKCLIHLIRDLNDDLLKNPFDEELKGQAARFTALLQAVVETVDRYGLKKCHLHKHQKKADRFFAAEAGAGSESERARHYRQRFLKSQDKLFTFLDHDGVPWNNNVAENAVKRFVSLRNVTGGRDAFTEAGLRDYLVLLSIAQTLRYRHASFWKFLLSGETDIDRFTARRR